MKKVTDKDETVKLMAKTIQNNLTKFIGETNTKDISIAIKETMTNTLEAFNNIMGEKRPLPTIEIKLEGTVAHIKLFDPNTGKEITVSDWISSNYHLEN